MPKLPLACALLLVAACASSPARYSSPQGTSQPARVAFRHIRQDQSMVLVNQAHTDRVELYSSKRSDLSTKVASDEVMELLIEYLHGQSRFFEFARPGPAPTAGCLKYGEAQLRTGTFHWALYEHSARAEADAFLAWQMNFIGLWNDVAQLQTVSTDFEFRPPPPPRKGPR